MTEPRAPRIVPVIVYAIALPLWIFGGNTADWIGTTMVAFLIGWSARGIVDMKWIERELTDLRKLIRR